jgi:hypothetical protein
MYTYIHLLMSKSKFSDLYIKYYTVKESLASSIDSKTGEPIYKYSEYQKYTVIKDFIPNDKSLYYLWGNVAYSLMFDCKLKNNPKIKKLIDLCFMIESKIKKGDIDIVFYDFINLLLPLLNTFNNEEIKMIQTVYREASGPLYEKLMHLTTPGIFIDLFKSNQTT